MTINALSPDWGTAYCDERLTELSRIEGKGFNASVDSGSFDSQQWAFVHRLIEAEEHKQEQQEREVPGGTMAIVAMPFRGLSPSELHSMAAYCQQSGCPLPKDLRVAMFQEVTNATLVGVIVACACCVSGILLGMIYFVVGLDNFGVVSVSDFAALGWLVRGWILGLVTIGLVTTCSLIFAVLGPSWASTFGICTWIVIWVVGTYSGFLATNVDVDPATRGIAVISDISTAAFFISSAAGGLLLR